MTMSPAVSCSPNAPRRSATWRTMTASFPVNASGSSCASDFLAVAEQGAYKTRRAAAGARKFRRAQHHVALENVALEDRFRIVERQVDVGELDGGRERRDGLGRGREIAACGKIAADRDGDFRLGRRLGPAGQARRCRRKKLRPLHQVADKRRRDLEFLHDRRRAETDFPAERLLARRDARAPRFELLRSMPRAMRGSSQGVGMRSCPSFAPRSPTPRSSLRPSSPRPARHPRSTCC